MAAARDTRAPGAAQGWWGDTPHTVLTAAFTGHSRGTAVASWFWRGSGGPIMQDNGGQLQAHSVLAQR